jgi:hypothetical protein
MLNRTLQMLSIYPRTPSIHIHCLDQPWNKSPAAYSTFPPQAANAFTASALENPKATSWSIDSGGNEG